ncbi:hypothetical protein ZIOFF_054314 [Zingiber officinale]|uniref:Uncharacterized protein n=1 Tax=Zingiber officinale TaxID=94328 RepID=A0A8J5KP84_ZINOF|nr:hypothetical protein ZIOFF_054314 [Zingiber officinale]
MASSPLHYLLPLLLICSNPLQQPTSASPSFHLNFAGEDNRHVPVMRHRRSKIFHPSTGLCVMRSTIADPLNLGPCSKSDSWQYTPQQFLMITGTYFCLEPVGLGDPVRLAIICESRWAFASESESEGGTTTHLTTELADGRKVCLDADADGTLVANSCNQGLKLGVDSQWFKLVTTVNNSQG